MGSLRSVETFYQRFGSMVNTALMMATLCGLLVAGGSWKTTIENGQAANATDIRRLEERVVAEFKRVDDQAAERWQEHAQLHKDRLVEVRASDARIDERVKTLEETKIRRDGQIENLQGRTSSLEALNRDIASKVNDVVSDTRVIKEILLRQERAQGKLP